MTKKPSKARKAKKPAAPKRARAGRPPFEPSPELRKQVEVLAAFLTQEEICKLVINPQTGAPIALHTLLKVFRAELDNGVAKANAKVGESLFFQAVGSPAVFDAKGNEVRKEQPRVVSAAIFWAKARMGWSEKNRLELTGKDGGPIQTLDVSKLNNEQLEQLEKILSAAAIAGAGESGDKPTSH